MELQEIKRAKLDLDSQLSKLVIEFIAKTGVLVENIEVKTGRLRGDEGCRIVLHVKAKLEFDF